MPVLNQARAWLETSTTLKVPEFNPTVDAETNTASSYIAARPSENFSLRYDHTPVEGYDLAWKLTITDEEGKNAVEQWGGPPMEMRKTKGVVKVRAMRVSEDGTRFREFAWSDDPSNALKGTITLSLHLCHFAEATVDVTPPAKAAAAPAGTGGNMMNPAGSKDGINHPEAEHPVLAPSVVRPQKSKLWTWYWRSEEPKDVFQFKFARKEDLQAEGIIPVAVASVEPSLTYKSSVMSASTGAPTQPKSAVYTHKAKNSTGSLFASSPRDLIKRKQSLSIANGFTAGFGRNRGMSTSSTESSLSSSSEEDGDE